MGRRALRRIDPALDLTQWLLAEEDLDVPVTAESLVGRAAPLEIEVGSGKGLFLAHATQAVPQHVFLGIEISAKYARHAAAGLATLSSANGRVVRGDGVRIFRERLVRGSIEAVHVYFPDPWWKQRHRKRRVMQEEFVRGVERVLRQGGVLHFWTDVEEYFRSTVALIGHCTTLCGPLAEPEQPSEHDMDYRTHFERRMRQHAVPVYRCRFERP
jgi:tRNA (guanine-N7-)-methyltransferase